MIDFNKHKTDFLKKLGSFDDWSMPKLYGGNPGYPPNSIFFGEALVLYSLAKEYKIDAFIESGVYRGGSTSVWCRVFPDIKLFSVDLANQGLNPEEKWNFISTEFPKMYNNISFIKGDGNRLLPKIIEENKNKKFGIFVDGPKDKEGIKLMEKCLTYENVQFSSLHDYTHKSYFSTQNNQTIRNIISEIDKNHIQFKKYPFGPGLVIIDKLDLLK